ncbi:MAG: 50S ribosomal protein L6, partial [Steroidobacteraceae bacterium]
MSRVAKKPVDLPQGVTATVSADAVTVKGAKGS